MMLSGSTMMMLAAVVLAVGLVLWYFISKKKEKFEGSDCQKKCHKKCRRRNPDDKPRRGRCYDKCPGSCGEDDASVANDKVKDFLDTHYPHWGWDHHEGRRCSANNNTGCNYDSNGNRLA